FLPELPLRQRLRDIRFRYPSHTPRADDRPVPGGTASSAVGHGQQGLIPARRGTVTPLVQPVLEEWRKGPCRKAAERQAAAWGGSPDSSTSCPGRHSTAARLTRTRMPSRARNRSGSTTIVSPSMW